MAAAGHLGPPPHVVGPFAPLPGGLGDLLGELGVGRELMAYGAGLAKARGYPRLEWSVLDWNEPAIGFYKNLGAERLGGWSTYRLSGEALNRLGPH